MQKKKPFSNELEKGIKNKKGAAVMGTTPHDGDAEERCCAKCYGFATAKPTQLR